MFFSLFRPTRCTLLGIGAFLSLLPNCAKAQSFDWFHPGHRGVKQVLFSPATNQVFSTGEESFEVKRWSLPGFTFAESWLHLSQLPASLGVELSGDGNRVVAGNSGPGGSNLTVLSASTGLQIAQSTDPSYSYTCFKLTPAGDKVLIGAKRYFGDDRIIERSLTGTANPYVYVIPGIDPTAAIEITADGNAFVTCGGGHLRFWKRPSRSAYMTFPERTYCATFLNNDEQVATGHANGKVIIWNFAGGSQLSSFVIDPTAIIEGLRFDPLTGNLLVVSNGILGYLLTAIDPNNGAVRFSRNYPSWERLQVCIPTSGRSILAGGALTGIQQLDRVSGVPLRSLLLGTSVGLQVCFSGADQVASIDARAVRVLQSATGKIAWERPITTEGGAGLATSPNGEYLACGSLNRIDVLKASTGALVLQIPHDAAVQRVSFSPDGRWLAFGDYRNTTGMNQIVVWDLKNQVQIARFKVPGMMQGRLAFTPDGRKLLVARDTGKLLIYNTSTWELTTRDLGIEQLLAISPDGNLIAVKYYVYPKRAFKLLRLSDFTEVVSINEYSGTDASFSPDSRVVWVAYGDIQAFDTQTGSRLFLSENPEANWVYRICLSADNGRIAFYRTDGSQGSFTNPLN